MARGYSTFRVIKCLWCAIPVLVGSLFLQRAPATADDARLLEVLRRKQILSETEYKRLKGSELPAAERAGLIELLRDKGILSAEEAAEIGAAPPAAAPAATAQPVETERRLDSVERQIQKLTDVPLQVGYDEGFFVRTPDENFSLRFNGRISNHYRFFEPDTVQNNTATIDRARLEFEGTFYKIFRVRVQNDFTSSSGLRDGFVAAKILPELNLQFGQYKVPFSYESLRSKRYIDFVERAAVVTNTVSPSRDIGVMMYGDFAGKLLAYQVAVMNGAGQNRSDDNSDKDIVGHLVLSPFVSAGPAYLRGFNFGGAATFGHQPRSDDGSVEGESETGFTFFPAVERRGKRIRAGGHLAWFHGPYSLTSEFIHTEERRDRLGVDGVDLPDLDTDGAYVGGTWMLTGETKPTNGRVRPARPLLSFDQPGCGAWELALRYEFFKLRHGADSALESGLDNRYDAIVSGVNWYPNSVLRLSLNYLYGHFDNQGLGSSPNPDKHSNNAVLGRVQLEF